MEQNISLLLKTLGTVREELATAKARLRLLEAAAQSAPHDSYCHLYRRSLWHIPTVRDPLTKEVRMAVESDCICWKSKLINQKENSSAGA